ncbi:Ig-like domain-containing protein [Psychroserpens sp. NJDZ02]|uniref:DUF7507 domain-containing protein n=1 Tax=Psychroserpens sp. NJDZ02 TaxID=2570561 RepID=UPI0010A76A14|nr:Ig-like domain-containing protein [Psychroserpens sp. NJDZ02]QCE43223.1 tandem-95 repeat protein [Psychroserpens sp. NJDZ02]
MRKIETNLKYSKSVLAMLIGFMFSCFTFAQTQSPSIQTGVTFQWSAAQPNNGSSAIIESITIDGLLYNTFVVPTSYEMTTLGPDGNGPNKIYENGATIASTSADPNWNNKALSAFQDKNLNHYYSANPNGRNVCGNFSRAETTDAQRQTIFYNEPIPSNDGGILAVTERGGNNCYYVEIWGIPVGGGPEQQLGNTFVRNIGDNWGCNFAPPINANSDYWRSGRCNENGQTIAIGLFYLNSIAPTGSKITKIEFVGATRDHGDGKFFLLQKYAVDDDFDECIDNEINGDLKDVANVPNNSTFSVISGPSPAGQSFNLNANGNYTYIPNPGYTGPVTFDYKVCLPSPNQAVCDEATVTINYQPLPSAPVVDISCNNSNDTNTINITSPVGSQYTYSINGGSPQNSTTFPNLVPGNYNINVYNTLGCTNASTTTINNALEISNIAISNAICGTGNTGSIDITVVGGTAPYSYAWNNSVVTQDNNNIPAGNYSVLVTDFNGCEAYMDAIIVDSPDSENPVITVPSTITIEGCEANDITVANSEFNYGSTNSNNVLSTFNTLSNYNVSDDVNVQSVTYIDTITSTATCTTVIKRTFTVTDDCGNTATAITNITIKDTTGPDLSSCNLISQTNEECSSANNNTIVDDWNAANISLLQNCSTDNCTVSANLVVTSNYYYSNFIKDCGTSGSITVTYTVRDECDNTSTTSATLTIEDNTGPDLTNCATINKTIECNSTSNQSEANDWNNNNIAALRNCGTDDCDIDSTNNVTSNFNFSNYVPNACGGTIEAEYSVIDDCGNITLISGVFTIIDTTPPNFNQSLPADITVTVDNIPNTPNITASDNCGSASVNFNETESGDVCTGSYTITRTWTATDQCDLTTTHTQIITVTQPVISATITSVTDVLCNSEATGSIDITVTGGKLPYTFIWNDVTNTNTEDLSNVLAGAYNVTITDANGCTTSIGATISEPTTALSLNITKVDATTAQGCSNGQATAIVSGGTSGYTYQWSTSAGSQTTATAIGLSNGTHSVTITDANNCTITQSIVIECVNTCDAEIAITNVSDVLCTGDTTGAGTVTANSDANPSATFTFTWSTGQVNAGVSTSTLASLAAGVYSVSVTIDGTVCQAVEATIAITEPSNALAITATTTDELGPTTNDGTATAVVTGGVEPYIYSWSPGGETTSAITGLAAGNYTVTVTDANDCIDSTTVTVNPGTCDNLSVTGTSSPAVCFGESNGSVTATVTGGSGNFSYSWDTLSNTTTSVNNLSAGDYTITVTDNVTLCTTNTTITINEPNILSSAIAVSNILCKGDATGSLDLAVNGGNGAYTFLWSNGATTEDLINVIAGNYSVTITDSKGCETTDSATILEPATNVSATISTQTDIVCEGLGTIIVEGAGGIAPYSYSIDGGVNYQTDGTFANLPKANYTVTVVDANGCTTTVTTEILINCTDAITDINNTFQDLPVTGNVLTNDEDYEGDTQTVTENTQPANGSVTIDPAGNYTYTPNAGFTGEDTFTYTICDDGNPQACDTATVYIEVLLVSGPGNEAPIANADTATTPEGTPVDIVVLTNDFDPDGDTITVTNTTTPDNGIVTVDPTTGVITYTPNDGFIGEDTFTYTICDDADPALCDTATVTVTVQPTDSPNTTNANDDAYTTTPGANISDNVLLNDNDIEGDNQTVTANTNPTNGTVTIASNGVFTYTPNSGFTGADSFTYTICDDNTDQACDTATVYITIGGIANTTDAITDINNTFQDLPVTGNVLTNDEDYEGDTQTVTDNTQPTNGSVTIDSAGNYTYTPNSGFTGEDTFTYTICDDGNPQACDTATVYIEVLPVSGPGNEAPIANADTATTPEGTPVDIVVLTNDFDPDGDTITVTNTTTPDNGIVTVDPTTGVITYTPNDGFIGEDTFTYTICDDADPALCDTATVTVTVQPTDSPNTTNANDDAYTTTPGANISDNVLLNDNDIEGDNQTVTANTNPTNGTVTIASNGDFTYTPNSGFTGADSFTYTICDDNTDQACDTATVYITIGGIANTTDAITDINNTFQDLPVTGNVLTNDEDYEGDTQTVTDNTQPTNGSVTIDSTGNYTYTPNSGFTGEDTFTYTICDDGNPQACDTATVYIEVLPVSGPGNEAPIANADTATTPEGTPVDIVVLTNDFDPDGDTITVTNTTTPDNGIVTVDPTTGVITYTPNDGFIGEDTFTYTICDDADPALCDTATVTVTVQPTDSPNTTNANDDAYTTTPTTSVIDNVLINDNDIEGDNQSVTSNTEPTNGTLTIAPNGDFTYTPNPGFSGTDSFTYTICDDNTDQACDTATVYITIDGVAGLNVVKSAINANGNTCIVAGDLVTYIFTVTNPGDLLINSITITDTLLGGDITADVTLTGDTNNDGLLDPSETWVYTAPNYTVTQEDVDAGVISNTVTISGLEPDGLTSLETNDTYVIDENNSELNFCTPTNGLNIVKSAEIANGDACLVVGSEVTYTFTVTNTGTVSVNSITITDALLGGDITTDLVLAGDNNTNGVIEPTETWIYTANNYTVTQADVDAGIITNTVTVDGIEILGNTEVTATDTYVIDENNTDLTFCTPTNGLNIVKSAEIANGDLCLVVGSEVTYTFTVTNTGTVSVNSITITDALLGGDITTALVLAGDTNTNGVIEPTETWIYTANNYTVTQADVDAGIITNTVTVDGIEILGNTDVTATDTYVIDENNTEVMFCTPTNGLNIVKSAEIANGDLCLVVGSEVTYTFTVTNIGTVSVNSITITDALLGGNITSDLVLAGDTNTNGVIEPTETWIYTANNYTVTQADVDAGIITNTVTVDGIEILGNTDVSATDTYVIDENNTEVTFCDPTFGLNIVKSAEIANGDECLVVGSEVTYTFTVTNTGTVSVNSITITDALLGGNITTDLVLAGDTNTNGVIEPTETWIYTANNYTVTQADVDAGIITNTVTVDGIEILGNTDVSATDTYVIDENNTEVMFCTPTNGLNIVKSAEIANGDECLVVGSEVTYTFTVTNTGTVSVNSITITDALLGGNITTDLVLAGDTNTNGVIEPTETWIYTANNYTVTQADVDAGIITNTVTVDGIEILGNTEVTATDTYVIDENNTEVTFCDPTFGLNIVKSAEIANGDLCLVVGSEVTYTFTVTNTGTVSVNSITITDALLGGNITTDLVLAGDTNTNGVIEPTETWIYTANNYTVTQADVDAGIITNTVIVDGIEILGNTDVTATDTYVIDENNTEVTFCDPTNGLNIVKSAEIANGDACLVVGSEVTYTFTVTNTGTVSVNSITITDALLGGDITTNLVLAGDTNTNGVIEPTETWIYTANNYTVTQTDVDAGIITNTVTVDGIEILGNTEVTATDTYVIDENNTEVTFCTPTSGLNIVKSAEIANGEECLVLGSEVTYTFTVTNTGTVSVNSITITDALLGGNITTDLVLAGDTNTNGVIEPTETWIYTANNYTVTQADVDAGIITNTVTVNGIEILGNTDVTATDTYVIDENNTEVMFCTPTNGLNIVKSAAIANAEECLVLGSEVTYTFTVTNTGTVSVNSITITDALLGGNITTDLVLAGDTNTNGVIEPTETWIYTANNYTVTQADVDAGIITNTVTVDGIEILGNTEVTATDTYVIDENNTEVMFCTPTALLNIVKTGVFNNDNANDCTEVDETITYTFTVTNTGTLSLENVVITDPLLVNAATPVSVTYVSGDLNSNDVLEPTETWIYTATYLVTQLDIDATQVVNTATATATVILNGETVTATGETTTELIEDTTPPNVTTCAVLDETIECDGDNNALLAETWNETNITALENCATDACDNNFTVTSNYDFANLVSTCGASGTIEVVYTLTDATGNATTFTATVNIVDTTGPELITPIDLPTSVICSNVPEIPELIFEDNCSITDVEVVFEETTTFTGSEEMYDITWTWTATDNCDNDTVITHTINVLTENFTTPLTADRCTEDGLLDLYEFLPEDADTDIEWEVVTDGITIVNGIFDPLEVEIGDYVFTYATLNGGCLNTYELTISVNEDCIVLPCGEDDLNISKAVTPNGDSYNEFFTVGGVEQCGFIIDLKIFNRFGDIVFESRDYQNDWNGESPSGSVGSAGRLPNGTYYYVINILDSGIKPIAGPLYLGTK